MFKILILALSLTANAMQFPCEALVGAPRAPTAAPPHLWMPLGGVVQLGPNHFRASIGEFQFGIFADPSLAGRQRRSNWCWAASVQMVLNYYGLGVIQEQVVAQIFGNLVDRSANGHSIIFALNSWLRGLGAGGANAFAMALNPFEIARSLVRKSPLIVALTGAGTEADGHAYIITAVDYFVNFSTWEVSISKITVRDPWPENPSEQELTWAEFAPRFMFAIGIDGLN